MYTRKGELVKSFHVVLFAALGVIGLGLTLAMHGEADDAPGLALIGIVLITGAYVFAVRTAFRAGQRSSATSS
jgi:multisubunit Na+/H+ antiporter MnhB subunit